MADTYRVDIASPLSFPADQRVRSGVLVTKQDGYEGELTDEQLKAIKADSYLTVKKLKAAPTKSTAKSDAQKVADAAKAEAEEADRQAKAKEEAEAKAAADAKAKAETEEAAKKN